MERKARVAEARASSNKEPFDFDKYYLLHHGIPISEGKRYKEEFWTDYIEEEYYMGAVFNCDDARVLWEKAVTIEEFVVAMKLEQDYVDFYGDP